MPRLFNRKVEIRFDDESLCKIDDAAKAYGLSRAEFIRTVALTGCATRAAPEAPSSPSKVPLTPDQYLSLVQHVYRALGGAVGRSTTEVCVAATLRKLYKG